MLKTIFFHGVNERFPMGEELSSELIIQINPAKGSPYCVSAFFTDGIGFWQEGEHGEQVPVENVVAWALMPEPSHHF